MRSTTTGLLAALAALATASAFAQAVDAVPWDEPVRSIATIDWVDALNPVLVNLGEDRFLFDTRQGVQTWDFSTRTLAEPRVEAAAGVARIARLDFGPMNWTRLGGTGAPAVPGRPALANAGTLFIGLRGESRGGDLLWWNPASRSVAAGLPLAGEVKVSHRLLSIDAQAALLCRWQRDASVVQLVRQGGGYGLRWASPGDPAVKAALQTAGVVGPVQGFGTLVAAGGQGGAPPVVFDTRFCGWDIVDPPAWLAPQLDPRKRTQPPRIKPYFLADGRVLVPELEYFHIEGQRWNRTPSALVWTPATREWTQLPSNRGEGNETHRVGQEEPVLATAIDSDLVEFFHAPTQSWRRSAERLPRGALHVLAEPLRSGGALVLLRETTPPQRGMIAVLTPAQGDQPPGRFVERRVGHFGEVTLPGHRLLLVGAGTSDWPRDAVESVDIARGLAGAVSPLPPLPRLPVSPSAVALADGSVLVFGGLPPRCDPSQFIFASGACADRAGLPSLRYWPADDRWEVLPQLKIPFSRGPYWQTGNSGLVAQWPRADVAVKPGGTLVWVEAADIPAAQEHDWRPRVSPLMSWSPAKAGDPPRALAPLRKGRTGASLIVLDDGRLAVIGGSAQLETVALEKDCDDCPDQFVSIGPFRPARSTEVLDESDPGRPVWKAGPLANFAGGRAFRLPGGRIFKLSLANEYGDGYQAEVADATFTAWNRLPPLPKIALPQPPGGERASVLVNNVAVVGARVLLLTNRGMTIVWDDAKRTWQVWKDWPAADGADPPLSVHPGPAEGLAFVRYPASFASVPLPRD